MDECSRDQFLGVEVVYGDGVLGPMAEALEAIQKASMAGKKLWGAGAPSIWWSQWGLRSSCPPQTCHRRETTAVVTVERTTQDAVDHVHQLINRMNEDDDDAAVDVGRVRVEAVAENQNKELLHSPIEP